MVDKCFGCKEVDELTLEHVIPQAIGGRLKANLYCGTCNSTFGSVLDAEISKEFGRMGTLLNIKRERGETQPFEVKEISTGTSLMFDGKDLKRKKPIIKIISKNGKKLEAADITAMSKKQFEEIAASIQKRYEVSGKMTAFQESHLGPTEARRK